MAETFQFELVSPERLIMSDPVDQVVVPGEDGYFTVLKGHAPFMSTMRPGVVEVTREGSGTAERIFVRGGFADISVAGLTILAEEAIPVEEVDREALAKEIRDREEDAADAKDPEARATAELRIQQIKDVLEAIS